MEQALFHRRQVSALDSLRISARVTTALDFIGETIDFPRTECIVEPYGPAEEMPRFPFDVITRDDSYYILKEGVMLFPECLGGCGLYKDGTLSPEEILTGKMRGCKLFYQQSMFDLFRDPEFDRIPQLRHHPYIGADPRPSRFFHVNAHSYVSEYNVLNRAVINTLLSWITEFRSLHDRDPRILVPACANGDLCALLRHEANLEPIGIDIEPGFVRRWKDDQRLNSDMMQIADAYALDRNRFPEGAFDAVLAIGIGTDQVTKDSDTERFISEMYRVLRMDDRMPGLFIWSGHPRTYFALPPEFKLKGPQLFLEPYFSVLGYTKFISGNRQHFIVGTKKNDH